MNSAIIIGDDHYNTLGVIRSLGEKKINIILILITSLENTFVDKSKYVKKTFKTNKDSEELMNIIIKCIKEMKETPVIFPTSDFVAKVIDDNYIKLEPIAYIPNAKGNIGVLQNKKILNDYAENLGLTVPNNFIIDFNEYINEEYINAVYDYPIIIKPLISIEGLKSDIIIAYNKNQMKKSLLDFRNNGYNRVLIQKYIYGIDECMIEVIGYSKKNGEVEIGGIIKKIREYPIKNGSTSYAKIVKSHDDIDLELIKKIVQVTKYCGLFDMEFKYFNGHAFFIELNFRNGAPSYIFTKLGINLPYLWYCNQINDEANMYTNCTSEYTFMCEQNDIINMLKHDVSFFTWIKQYVESKKVFFNIKDIRPILKYYYNFIVNYIK